MTSRFLYHALGLGLGGHITRPFNEVIEAQAATSLGIVGGYASGHVDAYRFKDIVSFRSARIHAVGSEAPDRSFNTSVAVTVEGLNILDVITAQRITARLTSRHAADAREPEISSIGTAIEDLRIGGRPVEVEVDRELFYEARTYQDFTGYAARKGERAYSMRESKGRLSCSLAGREEHAIRVSSVGTIYLGETFVSPYARRLTMLRVELGSPVGGRLEVASGEVNGSTYP